MKADKIVVLKGSKVVQQGTHHELLLDSNWPYWALASARRLSIGTDNCEEAKTIITNSEDQDIELSQSLYLDLEVVENSGEPFYRSRIRL